MLVTRFLQSDWKLQKWHLPVLTYVAEVDVLVCCRSHFLPSLPPWRWVQCSAGRRRSERSWVKEICWLRSRLTRQPSVKWLQHFSISIRLLQYCLTSVHYYFPLTWKKGYNSLVFFYSMTGKAHLAHHVPLMHFVFRLWGAGGGILSQNHGGRGNAWRPAGNATLHHCRERKWHRCLQGLCRDRRGRGFHTSSSSSTGSGERHTHTHTKILLLHLSVTETCLLCSALK